jgi:hypothetical protein
MSIELKSLRLGNLVFDDENKIMKVARIETKQYTEWNNGDEFSIVIEDILKQNSYYQSLINGIPITEEWLLKLGFNKQYQKGFIGIDVHNSDFVLTAPKVMGEWQEGYAYQYYAGNVPKFRELKYIHQLQNLFYSITEVELTLNDVSVKG